MILYSINYLIDYKYYGITEMFRCFIDIIFKSIFIQHLLKMFKNLSKLNKN